MPSACAVADCYNAVVAKQLRGTSLTFHRFPKDENLYKVWATKCRRGEARISFHKKRVCSDHFVPEDFERDLQSELLGTLGRRRLRPEAVPSVFPTRQKSKVNEDRKLRSEKRNQRNIIDSILTTGNNDDDEHNADGDDNQIGDVLSDGNDNSNDVSTELPELPVALIVANPACNCSGLSALLEENKKIKAELAKLKAESKAMKARIQTLTFIEKKFMKFFSTSQRQLIMGTKRVNWSTSDIVNALAVRSISPKCYDKLNAIFKLPLPSMRTLRRWTYKFTCEEGIFDDILMLLSQEAKNMDAFSRVCGLCFDEMATDSKLTIDPKFQCILSSSKVQVAMIRGLFKHWKQPIYYKFNTCMSKKLLCEIIASVEAAGFKVYSVTCDLAGENRSLLNELEISTSSCSFKNPSDPSRNIYVFPDVPHCLKNLRNHILDDGVVLPGDTVIDKSVLVKMAELNGPNELKLCPNFSLESLRVSDAERMRVRPAAQFFSHRMACLAWKTFPENQAIGNLFEIINDGFDVLNSRVPVNTKEKLKSGFGAFQFHSQRLALDLLKETLEVIRFRTKTGNTRNGLLPCQAGFITSINALNGLRNELRLTLSFGYILTARLNQDCLENFFAQIRSFSATNSHPTATEFRYRLKLVLLGSKNPIPRGSNVIDDGGNYLAAGLLSVDSKYTDLETSIVSADNESANPGQVLARKARTSFDDVDSDSLYYLAGYLAWSLKRKGKGVYGKITSDSSMNPSIIETSWLGILSRGGLMVPNESLHNAVLELEGYFCRLCHKFQNFKYGILKLFLNLRKELSHIDENIIKEFVHIRFKIRVKYLNHIKRSRTRCTVNRSKKKQFAKSSKC